MSNNKESGEDPDLPPELQPYVYLFCFYLSFTYLISFIWLFTIAKCYKLSVNKFLKIILLLLLTPLLIFSFPLAKFWDCQDNISTIRPHSHHVWFGCTPCPCLVPAEFHSRLNKLVCSSSNNSRVSFLVSWRDLRPELREVDFYFFHLPGEVPLNSFVKSNRGNRPTLSDVA